MQAQSLEDIFLNDDVMQGGIVWNAVPDYMFTTGQFFYRVKYLQSDAKLQAVNQDNPFLFCKKDQNGQGKKTENFNSPNSQAESFYHVNYYVKS